MIAGFSYNRRCHSFSYSSSRLDPHSDYRCFLIGREKPLCIFSLPSTSLRQSSLTARGRKLYALRMASGYLETLFHLYKNPVYIGKTAGYRHRSLLCRGDKKQIILHSTDDVPDTDSLRLRAVSEDGYIPRRADSVVPSE